MHFPAAAARVSAEASMVEAGSMAAEAATLEGEEGTDEHPASHANKWTRGDGNDA